MKAVLLTKKEKACLRLILFPMRPRDIAIELDMSVNTVNWHLANARRKLRVGVTLTAAHILRDAEPPSVFEGAGLPIKFSVSQPDVEPVHSESADASRETEGKIEGWDTPFARRGRPWNDLDLRWRIAWPVMLFFLVALGVSILTNGAASLSTMYLSVSR